MQKTILVVEDDRDIQEYYRFLFADLDVRVLWAGHGREALEKLDEDGSIDIILLDVVLPVMDGEAFFKVLRGERHSEIPVIICSVDERLTARVTAHGEVQGIFMKGDSGTKLVALIRGVLDGSRREEPAGRE